jgi:hypothetical protein
MAAFGTTALLMIVVGLIGARSVNYVTPLRPGPDAGVFASIAMQTIDGKVLYRDTADAKPPMVFALDALALAAGDGTFHSIRVLERFWAAGAAILVFLVTLTIFRRRALAAAASVGFSFLAYGEALFEQGNTTEEYSLLFVFAGIFCILRVDARRWSSSALIATSGACFACAALTKEPFLLSSLPWFLFLVAAHRSGWEASFRRALYFAAGALLPATVFLGYLLWHGAFAAWLDKVLGAMSFIGSLAPERTFVDRLSAGFDAFGPMVLFATRTGALAFACGAIAGLVPAFSARYRFVPSVALMAFAVDYAGATLSPTFYGHYFLQVVPAVVLCAASAGALLLDSWDRLVTPALKSRALLLLIPCVLDYGAIGTYWQRLSQPVVRSERGEVSTHVAALARPGDRLWVSAISNSRFYVETGLIPPTPFSHFFPGWFVDTPAATREQKVARLKADLAGSMPAWVIIGADAEALRAIGLLDWLCADYVATPVVDQGYGSPAYLYARTDRASTALPAANDPSCASVFVQASLEHYQRGEWELSIGASRKAIALDRLNVGGYNNMCVAHIQLRQYEQAIASCEIGLTVDPQNVLLRNNLAWARAGQARGR